MGARPGTVRSGSAERKEPEARRSGGALRWVLLLALLGAGAYFAYPYLLALRETPPPPPRAAVPPRPAPRPDAGVETPAAQPGAEPVPGETPAAGAALAQDAGSSSGDEGAADAGAPDAGSGLTATQAPADGGSAAAPPAADGGTAPAGRDFASYLAQGDRLRMRERPDSALFAYARAQELEPTRPEPHVGRGLALLDQGRLVPAERSFQQALRLDPKSGPALMGLAETYRAQGQKANARRYYEQYLETAPDGPDASAARNALERLKKD
jgi:hypothetical protein